MMCVLVVTINKRKKIITVKSEISSSCIHVSSFTLPTLSFPCSLLFPTDYFSVTLLKNRSAVEINHSGSYLLSITDSAIVLHWRTGAIAHHWPKRSVVKLLHHPKRKGHLILYAKR